MTIYDTRWITEIQITHKEQDKSLVVMRNDIMDFALLGHIVSDFDFKNKKKLLDSIVACFCVGEPQDLPTYVITCQ